MPAWAVLLAFLGDHSPPFVAGFLGAAAGALVARWYERRH